MKKNIIFVPQDKDIDLLNFFPKPSKNYIPTWFKKIPNKQVLSNKLEKPTVTSCVPFLDALTSGYTYELICDVQIIYNGKSETTNQDFISYNWAGPIRPLSTRIEEFQTTNLFPKFEGYYHAEFHWNSFWEPKTPKGYSTMYHHPSNRFDLPFQTMTGIIDTDVWHNPGPVPFLIKYGFEGIIPAGTPIIQTTFIKRENWISSKTNFDENKNYIKHYSVNKFFKGGYKKNYWQRKSFE